MFERHPSPQPPATTAARPAGVARTAMGVCEHARAAPPRSPPCQSTSRGGPGGEGRGSGVVVVVVVGGWSPCAGHRAGCSGAWRGHRQWEHDHHRLSRGAGGRGGAPSAHHWRGARRPTGWGTYRHAAAAAPVGVAAAEPDRQAPRQRPTGRRKTWSTTGTAPAAAASRWRARLKTGAAGEGDGRGVGPRGAGSNGSFQGSGKGGRPLPRLPVATGPCHTLLAFTTEMQAKNRGSHIRVCQSIGHADAQPRGNATPPGATAAGSHTGRSFPPKAHDTRQSGA